MNKYLLKISLLSLVMALILGTPVYSQDTDVDTSADTEVVTEGEGLEGIRVNEVDSAPSDFGLFFRDLRERAAIFFTFSQVKKAERRIKYAEERLLIAEKILEESNDGAAQERAQRVLDRAQNFIDTVNERKDRFLENIDENKERLLKNIANHHLRREEVFDRIEDRIPEEAKERFHAMRERLEERGRLFVDSLDIERVPERVKNHLMNVRERIEAHTEANAEFRSERRRLLDSGEDREVVNDRLRNLQDRRKENLQNIRQDYIQNVRLHLDEANKDKERREQLERDERREAVSPSAVHEARLKAAAEAERRANNQDRKPVPAPKARIDTRANTDVRPDRPAALPADINLNVRGSGGLQVRPGR